MLGENDTQQIIIVRRGGEGGEGHHGGAWKIAFADFMTAMMALFLVLWLINAANEETKKSVASYFNPIKLVDRNRSVKGLEASDSATGVKLNGEGASTVEEKLDEIEPAVSATSDDEAFFSDPNEALEEIVANQQAAEEEALFDRSTEEQLAEEAFGGASEPAFIDPFSPDFWIAQEAETFIGESSENAKLQENVVEVADTQLEKMPIPNERPELLDQSVKGAIKELDQVEPLTELADPLIDDDVNETQSPAEVLAAKIDRDLMGALKAIGLSVDQVTLVTKEKSVLISLADNLNFNMFGVGSAVPTPELVNAVAVIGKSIAGQPVKLSIVGHTDARPYRSAQYDNWRLSSARAHATLYMLQRGGIAEDNVHSIAGVADRQLRNTIDSFAPENRRIDIMVEFDTL